MNEFDPWTATIDEALAADAVHPAPFYEPDRPLYQWNAAREIEALRPSIENGDGFAVLDAVSRCARQGLALPHWLAVEFLRRYDAVLQCRAGSWDEAFGRPYPKRVRLLNLRQPRAKRWALASYFGAPGAPPRTRVGFEAAALALGITPRQAEEWTPKTRANVRGHKPQRAATRAKAVAAHDPFGLAAKRKNPR